MNIQHTLEQKYSAFSISFIIHLLLILYSLYVMNQEYFTPFGIYHPLATIQPRPRRQIPAAVLFNITKPTQTAISTLSTSAALIEPNLIPDQTQESIDSQLSSTLESVISQEPLTSSEIIHEQDEPELETQDSQRIEKALTVPLAASEKPEISENLHENLQLSEQQEASQETEISRADQPIDQTNEQQKTEKTVISTQSSSQTWLTQTKSLQVSDKSGLTIPVTPTYKIETKQQASRQEKSHSGKISRGISTQPTQRSRQRRQNRKSNITPSQFMQTFKQNCQSYRIEQQSEESIYSPYINADPTSTEYKQHMAKQKELEHLLELYNRRMHEALDGARKTFNEYAYSPTEVHTSFFITLTLRQDGTLEDISPQHLTGITSIDKCILRFFKSIDYPRIPKRLGIKIKKWQVSCTVDAKHGWNNLVSIKSQSYN